MIATVQSQDDVISQTDEREILNGILEEGCANWVRIGALFALGRLEAASPEPASENLGHMHPVVRETSLDALARLAPDRGRLGASHLVDDEAAIVRDVARTILQTEAA